MGGFGRTYFLLPAVLMRRGKNCIASAGTTSSYQDEQNVIFLPVKFPPVAA
jgi:hypothetical protein